MRPRSAALTLATLFFFGCQTVQVRAGPGLAAPPPAPIRVVLAEPELDLWLEGASQVSPQEIEDGLRRARAALGAALDGRGFARAGEGDHVLVVRSQGLARTEGRRSAQTAAVLGIVLIVAIIVVAIVASRDRGGGPHPARAGGAPGRAGGPRPLPPRPAYGYGPPPPWFGPAFSWGIDIQVPVGGPAPYPPAVAPTLEARLPSRGFFAGDETDVALELRDIRTGQVLWSRVASDEIDPRDARAVRALVDRMIGSEPWAAPLSAPAAPIPPPT